MRQNKPFILSVVYDKCSVSETGGVNNFICVLSYERDLGGKIHEAHKTIKRLTYR